MFGEIPNRRITERQQGLWGAAGATLGLIGGIAEVIRNRNIDLGILWWLFLFVVGLLSYLKGRHPDPYTPPLENPESLITKLNINGELSSDSNAR